MTLLLALQARAESGHLVQTGEKIREKEGRAIKFHKFLGPLKGPMRGSKFHFTEYRIRTLQSP